MDMDLFEKIRLYAEQNLSCERYEHSVRVSETAALMCRLYGIDEQLGALAGIAHDICKEIPVDEILSLVKQDGLPVEGIEKAKPNLLHGRAAAVKIQSEFKIKDKNVIEAVANHTFGCPGLCDLGKILFVADKIEPGRPRSTDEYRERHFKMTLNEITLAVIDENIEYLARKGKTVAPVTKEWADELRNKKES